jgi:hypothetical protein
LQYYRPSVFLPITKASIIVVEREYLDLRGVVAQLMLQLLLDEDHGDSEAVQQVLSNKSKQ